MQEKMEIPLIGGYHMAHILGIVFACLEMVISHDSFIILTTFGIAEKK